MHAADRRYTKYETATVDGVSSYKRKGDGKTTKSARDRMTEGNKVITLGPAFRSDDDAALAAFVEKNKLNNATDWLVAKVANGELPPSGARAASRQRAWRRDGQCGCCLRLTGRRPSFCACSAHRRRAAGQEVQEARGGGRRGGGGGGRCARGSTARGVAPRAR